MTIHLLSVTERDGCVRARARAVAPQARISVEVWFDKPRKASKRRVWQEARDRVLSVLDPA